MAKTSATKPKQAKNKKYMLVRYRRMNLLGFFEHNQTRIPKGPARVVVKTDKGLELGYLTGQLSSYKGRQFRLSNDQVKKYFGDSQVDFPDRPVGRVIRYAAAEDISEEKHLQKIAEQEMERCKRFVREFQLPMKIVDAEHIFGGEHIIFYFMSESRVDFRELVKKLAHEYQTRIEMRQIGSRDEAKLLGDVESCGQECCCKKFLKALKSVNMRMAKMQKATLDPSKISGYCGRLKCCLRYEDKTYTELKKQLPKKNTKVQTQYGQGKVVDSQILTQLVVVEFDGAKKTAIPLEEIQIIALPKPSRKKQDSSPEGQAQEETGQNNKQDNEESKEQ